MSRLITTLALDTATILVEQYSDHDRNQGRSEGEGVPKVLVTLLWETFYFLNEQLPVGLMAQLVRALH